MEAPGRHDPNAILLPEGLLHAGIISGVRRGGARETILNTGQKQEKHSSDKKNIPRLGHLLRLKSAQQRGHEKELTHTRAGTRS